MPEHAAIPFHEDIGGRVTPRGSHNPDSQGVISNERTIYDVYIGLHRSATPGFPPPETEESDSSPRHRSARQQCPRPDKETLYLLLTWICCIHSFPETLGSKSLVGVLSCVLPIEADFSLT